jgi:DNA primase
MAMARIPEAEIERLKEGVPVQRLIEASGIELKQGGKDLLGRCPFHEDATASLVVTPPKNLWHCFGCGAGGGPIDWVMKRQGVSFRHAVELLRADLSLAAGAGEPVARNRAKLPAPVALDAGEQELLDQVIGYYHETLLASPEALAYLERRGIANRELIEQHRLGFANRTLGLRSRPGQRSEVACKRWASCATAGTSTSTAAWWCRSSMRLVRWWRCTAANCWTTCARAHRCTCTCPGRTGVCGMSVV